MYSALVLVAAAAVAAAFAALASAEVVAMTVTVAAAVDVAAIALVSVAEPVSVSGVGPGFGAGAGVAGVVTHVIAVNIPLRTGKILLESQMVPIVLERLDVESPEALALSATVSRWIIMLVRQAESSLIDVPVSARSHWMLCGQCWKLLRGHDGRGHLEREHL